MGSPPRHLQTEIEALRGAELVKAWTLPSAIERINLRRRFAEEYDPRGYLKQLRQLPDLPRMAAPVFCLSPGIDKRPRPLDSEDRGPLLVRMPFGPSRSMPATTAGELRLKEAVYLARRRQAYADLRDDIWKIGGSAIKQVADKRGWGRIPQALSRLVHDCRRNRKDNRASVKEVWDLWPAPFEQLAEEWDEIYLAEFPEVVDRPERPGSTRWRNFYSPFTRDFIARPPPKVQQIMRWPTYATHTPCFEKTSDALDDLDRIVTRLDRRFGREPSRERPLLWNERPAAERPPQVEGDKPASTGEKEAVVSAQAGGAQQSRDSEGTARAEQPTQQVRRTKRAPRPKRTGSPNPAKKRQVHVRAEESRQVGALVEGAGTGSGSSAAALGMPAPLTTLPLDSGAPTDREALQYLRKVILDAVAILAVGAQQTSRSDFARCEGASTAAPTPPKVTPSEVVRRAGEAMRKERYRRANQAFVAHLTSEETLEAGRRLAHYADCPPPRTAHEARVQISDIVAGLTLNVPALVVFITELLMVGYKPKLMKPARDPLGEAAARAEGAVEVSEEQLTDALQTAVRLRIEALQEELGSQEQGAGSRAPAPAQSGLPGEDPQREGVTSPSARLADECPPLPAATLGEESRGAARERGASESQVGARTEDSRGEGIGSPESATESLPPLPAPARSPLVVIADPMLPLPPLSPAMSPRSKTTTPATGEASPPKEPDAARPREAPRAISISSEPGGSVRSASALAVGEMVAEGASEKPQELSNVSAVRAQASPTSAAAQAQRHIRRGLRKTVYVVQATDSFATLPPRTPDKSPPQASTPSKPPHES